MSFLTPLYALGALAVAAPIVFHLIRRMPRGEVPFSSLMFLAPTPPRLTRRSRLDHVLLLLLRATALVLLAIAFARPFLRRAARLDFGGDERRRVAVLIDTSASMRRGDVWARARRLADEAIAACRPGDQLAVLAFDESTRPLLGFAESATLDPSRRKAVAQALVARLEPTWGGTRLGQALIDAVAAVEDVADASEKAGRMPRRVVLISDLQQGSHLEALGDFEWPTDVELELKTVADRGSNAGVQPLADPAEGAAGEAAGDARVRVANDPDSRSESFRLAWVDGHGTDRGKPVDVYVPPGESRVVRVPRPPGGGPLRVLRLSGDTHVFDNRLYIADEGREEATVLFVGDDGPDDPAGLLYYLGRVFTDTPRRRVRVAPASPARPLDAWESGKAPALVIVAGETTPENARRLRDYALGGGTVLAVIKAPGRAPTLGTLADVAPPEVGDAKINGDVMLGEIAFDHPLFAPLAGPQFNDFTKIHFWKYRRIDSSALGEARVVARFDDGGPAILEKPVGKGRLVVWTSGWAPADSQFARSSKFVPLMASLLEGPDARAFDAASYRVGDRVPLPASADADRGLVVRKPGGATAKGRPGAPFAETDEPGVYTVETRAGPRSFAVNLDPSESKTAPLHVETLEQFGCRLASHARKAVDPEHLRQMHNAELENRQKLWRWLILAALGILIVETWLAGRLGRPRPARAEALAT